jgi:hypothetical protein
MKMCSALQAINTATHTTAKPPKVQLSTRRQADLLLKSAAGLGGVGMTGSDKYFMVLAT